MSNYSFFIGSDVSKHVIDVTYTFDGNTIYLGQFQNSSSGFKHVIKNLKKLTDIPTKNWFFCFENTGQYSKPLLFWLINNEIPCREESALKIRNHLAYEEVRMIKQIQKTFACIVLKSKILSKSLSCQSHQLCCLKN